MHLHYIILQLWSHCGNDNDNMWYHEASIRPQSINCLSLYGMNTSLCDIKLILTLTISPLHSTFVSSSTAADKCRKQRWKFVLKDWFSYPDMEANLVGHGENSRTAVTLKLGNTRPHSRSQTTDVYYHCVCWILMKNIWICNSNLNHWLTLNSHR